MRGAVGYLLDQASVADLTVEDPPLEEVMRELFAKTDEPVEPTEPTDPLETSEGERRA